MIFHDFNEKVKYILYFYNTFCSGTIFNFILAFFYHANAHSKIFTKYYSRKRFILVGREVSLNKNKMFQKYLESMKIHDFSIFLIFQLNVCARLLYNNARNIMKVN